MNNPVLIIVAGIVVIAALIIIKVSFGGKKGSELQTLAEENKSYSGMCKNVAIKSSGANKLAVIKYVREATGMSLKEAKDIVEARGTVEGLPYEVAELLVEKIPAIPYCEDCGEKFGTVEHGKKCPHCGSDKTYLLQGNEFNIKEIEAC